MTGWLDPERVWSWLSAVSWQVALLGLLVLVADLALARRRAAELRAALWSVVMVKLALPPDLISPVSIAKLVPAVLPDGGAGGASASEASPPGAAIAWLLAAWIVVALALQGMLLLRCRRMRSDLLRDAAPAGPELIRRARRAADRLRLRRLPRLVVVRGGAAPAMLGVLAPVVVLPQEIVARVGPVQLEHVLLHELAHVKRRDALAAAACCQLRIVFWFHPVVWWAGRRLEHLRELCCDATVAAVLREETPAYRRTLAQLARALVDRPSAAAHGLLGRASGIVTRLEHLDRPLWRRSSARRSLAAACAAVLMACVVPLANDEAPPPPAACPPAAVAGEALEAGCLRLRYTVFGLLAGEEKSTSKSTKEEKNP